MRDPFKPGCIISILILLISIQHSEAQSQHHTVTGLVKDSSQLKSLSYVTVSIFRQDSLVRPIKVTYTNDKGKYAFDLAETGNYTIIYTHTGFSEKQQNIKVTDKLLELPDVTLDITGSTLKGVTVVAHKPLIEQSDDKITFNVENDPASKTESALDLLRKTPFVSVDGDDNIQVNGQSNFKVLLNGRETSMFAQNVKEAMKGFPGNLIVKIEVITTPSAKYDAEGVGGIINIITKKKVVGYNGSLSVYYSNTGWKNINTNLSAKFGKFGASLFYGGGGSTNIKGVSTTETIPFVSTIFTRRLLQGNRLSSNFWNFGNGELSYEIDSLNTLSAYGNVSGGWNKINLNQTVTTNFPTNPSAVSYYTMDSRVEYPTESAGLDYIKKFSDKKDKEFTIRLNAEFGNNNNYINSLQNTVAGIDDRYIINNSMAHNKQYTIESDYTLPINTDKKLESGIKGIFRLATSNFSSSIKTNPADNYKINPANTDFFDYKQNVYAAYTTYNFKIKKTGFRIGGRVEHTEVNGNFTSSATSVKQSYTTWLPNLQGTIKMNNLVTLVIAYNMRLQRPFIANLNPFVNNNDSLNLSYGNPQLNAQTIHSLSLQTRIMKGGTFAGLTLTGSYSNNMIVQYATFDSITAVTRTTSANIGKEFQLSLNSNISAKINENWNVFFNGNVRFNRVQNKLAGSQVNSGIGGNGNMNSSYKIGKKFTASSYAGFWRSPVTIQTKYPLNTWYGIGMGIRMFNDKVTASLSAANFLQKYRDYRLVTYDPSFQTTTVSTLPFRGLGISLDYNFGKLTESVSKKKGVNNDDLLTTPASN